MSLASRADQWRTDLAAWAIPDDIAAAAADSPWVLPTKVFARRADRLAAAPAGPSFERAWAALDPPGSVLDIGAGAGAACLPLIPRCTRLTAVDTDAGMLAALAQRADAAGCPAARVHGDWPDVADQVPPADVVTCHHVLYNIPVLIPFVAALTSRARRLVVVEMTARHPLVSLNPLWLSFHGLRRPVSPTADDLLAILTGMGLEPGSQRWRRPSGRDYGSFEELVDVTRRRLCLAQDRAADVAAALVASGIDPRQPGEAASSGRDVVTIWWSGGAGEAGEPARAEPARAEPARAEPARAEPAGA
jgi:SAM-dependent methyltransferase